MHDWLDRINKIKRIISSIILILYPVNSVSQLAFTFSWMRSMRSARPVTVVGLDENAVGLQALARDVEFVRQQRAIFLQHARDVAPDDRLVRAAQSGIGQVGRAAGKNLVVGGLHMGVRADDERGEAVARARPKAIFSEVASAWKSIRMQGVSCFSFCDFRLDEQEGIVDLRAHEGAARAR